MNSTRNSFYSNELATRNELSARAYNVIIGATLLYGFAINALMCKFMVETTMQWNPLFVIIGYFLLAITGIFMSHSSDNALVSFIGYNLVVIPVGVVLTIALAEANYTSISVFQVVLTTGLVTAIMLIAACIVPDVFLSMGKVLFMSLLIVIILEVIFLAIGFATPTLWDAAVALIFCGYIGYDWAKAQEQSYTVDHAVDAAVGLYLDIINLFIRLLEIMGKKNDD